MKRLKNNSELKVKRQELRRNQTESEKLVWAKLRNRQLGGFKFFRQYSVGPYILDFYCPEIKIAMEIDGGQHEENKNYDNQRTIYLRQKEIEVLRFWNNDVVHNIDGLLEEVMKNITPLTPLNLRGGLVCKKEKKI
jgi:very-short-patch-repair endonuclease